MPEFLKKLVRNQKMNVEDVSKNDQLLFHPCADELDQTWIHSNISGNDSSSCVSCSRCFTAISYSAQEAKKHEYTATKVVAKNLKLDQSKLIQTN